MRIALLTDGITPYVTGGMQRHSFNLCRELVRNGVHVDLYHCDPANKGARELEVFSPEERSLITSHLIEFPSFGSMPGHYLRESVEYSRRIYKHMQKQTLPDFIYAKGFTAWELLHQKSKGWKGPKIGVNFHGYEMFQNAPSFMERLKQKFLLRSPVLYNIGEADYVFSYGGKVTEIIVSLGVNRAKIIEIPGGADEDLLVKTATANHMPLRFVFVGRDERRKGLKELGEALRQLKRQDWECHFIGEIKVKISGANYIYHGEISSTEEMKVMLCKMDVLVCPSISEGMPNVILEGMASGLAILATNVGATACMVSEKNGWLIAPGSVGELTEALTNAMSLNQASLKEKKENSFKIVSDNFLWSRIGQRTMVELNRIIAEK